MSGRIVKDGPTEFRTRAGVRTLTKEKAREAQAFSFVSVRSKRRDLRSCKAPDDEAWPKPC